MRLLSMTVLLGIAAVALCYSTAFAFVPGDLNDDGAVNNADLAILGQAWNAVCGSATFNPNADLNSDCVVDVVDLAILGKFWSPCEGCSCGMVEEGCENDPQMANTTCVYGYWLCRNTPIPDAEDGGWYFDTIGFEIVVSFIHQASCAACSSLCEALGAVEPISSAICSAACMLWCSMPDLIP